MPSKIGRRHVSGFKYHDVLGWDTMQFCTYSRLRGVTLENKGVLKQLLVELFYESECGQKVYSSGCEL
jgi:hypothetical protein